MKLPEFEKCKCCKIRKLNNGDIRLCCEPPFWEYFHTTCEERRTEHPEPDGLENCRYCEKYSFEKYLEYKKSKRKVKRAKREPD